MLRLSTVLALILGTGTASAFSDEARRLLPRSLADAADAVQIEHVGPVTTLTVELALSNTGPAPQEAELAFDLPADMFVGRLALLVEGRWMEGEVLTRTDAQVIYSGIVARMRDPALLVETWPGRWSLKVFPVPGATQTGEPGAPIFVPGSRRVILVLHRIAPKEAGVWVEEMPALGGQPASRWFAAVASPVSAAKNVPVVVALDRSLSQRHESGEQSDAVVALTRGRRSEVVWIDPVRGGIRSRACPCTGLPTSEVGGGTDLAALLGAARVAADRLGPDAEVALVTDGQLTHGSMVFAELAALAGKHPVHVLATGIVQRAPLDAIVRSTRGRFGLALDEVVDGLGRRHVAPRIRVEAGEVADLVWYRGVIFGRLVSAEAELRVGDDEIKIRAPHTTVRGQPFGPSRTVSRGATLRRAAAFAGLHALAPADALIAARRAGIAAAGAAFLALERDEDYVERAIVRVKNAELAVLSGLPVPELPHDWPNQVERRPPEAGRDGDDRCPGVAATGRCPEPTPIPLYSHGSYDPFRFARGSSVIAKDQLRFIGEVAKVMQQYPHITLVVIDGHAEPGEARHAGRLALARAEAVLAELVRRGINADRLVARGFGSERPVAPNDTPQRRARNRRVEITIGAVDDELQVDLDPSLASGVVRARILMSRAAKQPDENIACREVADALALAATVEVGLSLYRGDELARRCAHAFMPLAYAALADSNVIVPADLLRLVFDIGVLALSRAELVDPDKAVARCAGEWFAVVPVQCAKFLLAARDPRAKVVFRERIDAFLARLADPMVRARADRRVIEQSAELLHLDGREDEARVRAAEGPEVETEQHLRQRLSRP